MPSSVIETASLKSAIGIGAAVTFHEKLTLQRRGWDDYLGKDGRKGVRAC